jgi:hypothetical protein
VWLRRRRRRCRCLPLAQSTSIAADTVPTFAPHTNNMSHNDIKEVLFTLLDTYAAAYTCTRAMWLLHFCWPGIRSTTMCRTDTLLPLPPPLLLLALPTGIAAGTVHTQDAFLNTNIASHSVTRVGRYTEHYNVSHRHSCATCGRVFLIPRCAFTYSYLD